ncbi:hypothetical protein [Methylobacterium indicum]|uniref:Uncharacterized protein n=1 Tax=Methylobacterium indicum TaxID=1775910 RepID=A0ABR5H6D8_9HYPH|nr:hypothetical protein [Methylobacterium indicum]KMO17519.1 hypothetical protein QR78_17295 [Methylobacterium indicum]KMO19865.1 hypothetical protein QR79_19100 [Methylobacterium indicum]
MTRKRPGRVAVVVDMLRAEVASADQLRVQLLRTNARAHLRNALVYAERSDELDMAADDAWRAVLAFVEGQRIAPAWLSVGPGARRAALSAKAKSASQAFRQLPEGCLAFYRAEAL